MRYGLHRAMQILYLLYGANRCHSLNCFFRSANIAPVINVVFAQVL